MRGVQRRGRAAVAEGRERGPDAGTGALRYVHEDEPATGGNDHGAAIAAGRAARMVAQIAVGTSRSRHFAGQAAPVSTHAATSAFACCWVPGAGWRPKPGAQAQPTSVSSPM